MRRIFTASCTAWLSLAVVTALLALPLVRKQSAYAVSAATNAPHLQDPDRQCAGCHAAIYRSYEQTSMARGSGTAVEALHTGTFRHAASGVTYTVSQKDGVATLRSERDSSNAPLDERDQLAYFIGSGKHGRTYLFSRNAPSGEGKLWHEAPVNWYTRRASYGMAPAYDNAQSAPLALPTDPNCLHCHVTAVQPSLPSATNAFRDQPFLQGGVGCSGCHGDPAAHLQSQGKTPMLRINALAPAKRDSVCLQCHLEGDALVQKAGRSLSAFQPGDDLSDTAIYFVNASSPKSAQRASSQYEGMLRSACRRAAGDRLTCTTCHDPHSTPAPEERVAFYREKCLQCHADSATFRAATHHPEQQDCASCHMPSRATSDISHEQNVDHDIEARPRSAGLQHASAALSLHSLGEPAAPARFTHAVDLVPVGAVQPGDREIGLAYAQFAAHGDRDSMTRALSLLHKVEFLGAADARVHEQLGYLAQIMHDGQAARSEYEATLKTAPNDATALANLGVIEAQAGDLEAATRHLNTAATNDPGETAAVLNLAMLQCRANHSAEAKALLQRALVFNPDSVEARLFLRNGDYAGMHCQVH